MIQDCSERDVHVFAELKRQRENQNNDLVTIDGETCDAIPERFANVYSEIYNTCDDDENIEEITEEMNMTLKKPNV